MSTSDSNCKDGSSKKSNNDGVCEVNDKLQNMSIGAAVSICANCGKKGDEISNVCNKCKQVRYCNAVCKKVHKNKHQKECEELIRRATEKRNDELRIAADLHDKELFKQPQPAEDCPICFLRMPSLAPTGYKYYACCGKVVCSGCCHAPVYDNEGNKVEIEKCPFCRTPTPTSEKVLIETMKIRVEKDDPIAMYNVGCCYRNGDLGLPQDYNKALELYHRAGELGHAAAYMGIGLAYGTGRGVKVDKKKEVHYYELAAMGGDVEARCDLGNVEARAGNIDRALKHYLIAIGCGDTDSLNIIKGFYSIGHATKEDYTKALQLYQAYLGEIKSKQRDEAAAFSDDLKYYKSGL